MWLRQTPSAPWPGRRSGHTFTLVPSAFGCGTTGVLAFGKGSTSYHADAMALALKDASWSRPTLHGKAVVARWQHAAQALSDRRAVLLTGGLDPQGNALWDPLLLDISSGNAAEAVWHWCSVINTGESPQPRAGHSMTALPGEEDCFLVFGGKDNNQCFADVHRAQVGHAAAAWDRPCPDCSDTCEAAACRWTRLHPTGAVPSPRTGHAAAIFERSLVVLGGESEKGLPVDDCHVLDLEMMNWSALLPSLPFPLSNHSAVSLPAVVSSFCFAEPTLLVFGGRTLRPNLAHAPEASQPAASTGPRGWLEEGPACFLQPAPEFDLVEGMAILRRDPTQDGQLSWRTHVAAHESPCARELSAMAYDDEPRQGRRIFVFGGQEDVTGLSLLQDLYVLDVSSADIRPRPRIDGITPLTGTVSGGEEVEIFGENLGVGAARVRFVAKGPSGQTVEVEASSGPSGGVVKCATPPWKTPTEHVEVLVSVDSRPFAKCPQPFAFRAVPPPPEEPAAVVEQVCLEPPEVCVPSSPPDSTPAPMPLQPPAPPSPPTEPAEESRPRTPTERHASPEPEMDAPAAKQESESGPSWRKEGDGTIPFSYRIRSNLKDAKAAAAAGTDPSFSSVPAAKGYAANRKTASLAASSPAAAAAPRGSSKTAASRWSVAARETLTETAGDARGNQTAKSASVKIKRK